MTPDDVQRETSGLPNRRMNDVFLVLSRVPPISCMDCPGHWMSEGSDNLELVGVVLVEEGDGDAHDAVVVAGDRVGERHFDRIVVVVPVVRRLALDLLVFAEPQVVLHGHERQLLMAAAMVQVCVPADALDADVLDAVLRQCDEPAAFSG